MHGAATLNHSPVLDASSAPHQRWDLQAADFQLDLIGFSADELQRITDHGDGYAGEGDPEPGTPDPEAVAVSRLGDVWILGKHRLACGDCTDADAVARLMAGEQATLLHADPPYGMDAQNFGDGAGTMGNAEHHYDDSQDSWITMMSSLCPLLYRVSKPQAHAYVFCDFDKFHELKTIMQFVAISLALLPLQPIVGDWYNWLNIITMSIATVLTLWSGYEYVRDGIRARAQKG